MKRHTEPLLRGCLLGMTNAKWLVERVCEGVGVKVLPSIENREQSVVD